jgi:hypothetical protein
MNELSYGQQIDERSGLVRPWYTPAFFERLKTWDLSNKRVFEFGGGKSTIWWAYYANEVFTAESNIEYHGKILEELNEHSLRAAVAYRPTIPNEVELKSAFVQAIYEIAGEFDIVIIDSAMYRDECVAAALTKIKDGGIIICDNWDQDFVWDSIMASRLLDGFQHEIFIDPDHKDHVGRPWKTGYWIIDKGRDTKKDANNLLITYGDYDSHRPMLWMALEHIKPMNEGERSDVVELGCGYGSTPLLKRYCEMQQRLFASFENNLEWLSKFPDMAIVGVANWKFFMEIGRPPADIVFIDNAPGETRKDLIPYFANSAKIVIVHDTEPGAEHDYKMAEALNAYKHRCDLIIEGAPQTTAVSNVYDFQRWKGLTLGKYKFI